jgi:hypothetical protein
MLCFSNYVPTYSIVCSSTDLKPESRNHWVSKYIVASVRVRAFYELLASRKIGHVGFYESKVFFVVVE